MNIAYVRVSTEEQNEERQVEGLKKHGIEKWFLEKVSAKTTDRPQLRALLDFAREGDTIYVHDLSRLARSTRDLLELVEFLEQKGIGLVSNKEAIDTSTATGKLMLTMIGAIAEFERQNLLERQREGIALAKGRGIYTGRKRIDYPKDWQTVYDQWKMRKITGDNAMQQLGLKRNTFYRLVHQWEQRDGEKIQKSHTVIPGSMIQ
jgi:DNA invertase Pin-like site-specific DNA recombinase